MEQYKIVIGQMVSYPTSGRLKLGYASFLYPGENNELTITSPSFGPNMGARYVAKPLPGLLYAVNLYPGLVPPPAGIKPKDRLPYQEWYFDQNAYPPGTCNATQLATIRQNVRRHEGALGPVSNSHPGVSNNVAQTERPDKAIERLFTLRDDRRLKNLVDSEMSAFFDRRAWKLAQARLDTTDYTVPGPVFPCPLDLNRSDP